MTRTTPTLPADPCGTVDMLDLLAGDQLGAAVVEEAPEREPVDVELERLLAAIRGADRRIPQQTPPSRVLVVRAILMEARQRRGYVDPNRVRDRLALSAEAGGSFVHPSVVGGVYGMLLRRGLLERAEWVASTCRTAGGRLIPAYHLTIPEGTAPTTRKDTP